MRAVDVDTSEEVWKYRPSRHKNEWRDEDGNGEHDRVIVLGPKAQELLRPWLDATIADPAEYLFQPREARLEQDRRRSAERHTTLWPSHERNRFARRKGAGRRGPRDHYTVDTYGRAITRACESAFPFPLPKAVVEQDREKWEAEHKAELKRWRKEHRWTPNQLRHTKATEIRRNYPLDAAQAVLGHRHAKVTEMYAELQVGKAAEVMQQLG
jgi:site-specific recombinase XerD